MNLPMEGGCLCGAIRYRLHDGPLTVYACHCTDCQKRTGTSFAISMLVMREALDVLRGEPSPYFARLDDGRTKGGKVCAACGSRLWGEPVPGAALVVLQPGTLDDTSWIRPVAHIWTRSMQQWIRLDGSETRIYETQPANMADLIGIWAERDR